MDAVGGRRAGTAGRASVPRRRTGLLRSGVPGSRAIAPGHLSSTAVADTSSSDGGASVGGSLTGGHFAPTPFSGGHTAFRGRALEDLRRCLALAEAAVESMPEELTLAGFGDAADFADLVEGLSRRVGHLQLLATAVVDRTRTAAINAAGPALKAAGWTTGWGTETAGAEAAAPVAVPAPGPVADGCRNTAEFLRVRLRISAAEARRRLAVATAVLPRTGITGQPTPPHCEHTAAVLAAGTIASRAGTIITTALDKNRPTAHPAMLH
ncbi:DUF222 domain-containing protein, partial [Arthrobacter sp. ISL-28]|uniref:DUF222 domain-containing protein n=1 Tax=Arthrobacter sp. ISL-28 TaxID=2819108 RepID=UPI001BE7D497